MSGLLDRPALLLALWLALMSAVAFAAMGADKVAAVVLTWLKPAVRTVLRLKRQ